MKEDNKKDAKMPLRVFLRRNQYCHRPLYIGREEADDRYTEYVNIGKVWHSNKEFPDENDLCLIDSGGRGEYILGRFFTTGYEAGWDVECGTYYDPFPMRQVLRWAYIEDLLPSRK